VEKGGGRRDLSKRALFTMAISFLREAREKRNTKREVSSWCPSFFRTTPMHLELGCKTEKGERYCRGSPMGEHSGAGKANEIWKIDTWVAWYLSTQDLAS
jgi:hypothetical protein